MKNKLKYIPYSYPIFLSIFCLNLLSSCTLSASSTQYKTHAQTSQDANINTQFSQDTNRENTQITTVFTDTFKATLEEVLDASLNHISSHYMIDDIYIEKENSKKTHKPLSPVHIIKASFNTNKPHNVLDCGTVRDEALLPDGTRFSYVYQGADSPVFTMEKRHGEYKNASKSLDLKGEITLTIQEISSKKISVNVLTKYILKQEIVYTPLKNTRTLFRENTKEITLNLMQFYTGETGLFYSNVPLTNNTTTALPIENSIQCQAKANIEESILQAIAQHLD